MGGGGKGGRGGGAQVPQFVVDTQKQLGELSQSLFDITNPAVQEGASQIQSLITTGGRGPQIPIIANLETGQQRAFSAANQRIADAQSRAAGSAGADPSFARIQNQVATDATAARRAIGPSIAAPIVSGAMGSALGGPAGAQAGFAAGAQAINAGTRIPQRQSQPNFLGLGQQLAQSGFGGGKGGGQTFGSGTSNTGSLIIGNSGMLGGGV